MVVGGGAVDRDRAGQDIAREVDFGCRPAKRHGAAERVVRDVMLRTDDATIGVLLCDACSVPQNVMTPSHCRQVLVMWSSVDPSGAAESLHVNNPCSRIATILLL